MEVDWYGPAVLTMVLFSHAGFYVFRPSTSAAALAIRLGKFGLSDSCIFHLHLLVVAVDHLACLCDKASCVLICPWCVLHVN